MDAPNALARQLGQQALLRELVMLMICVALAAAVAWLAGRRSGSESVWFGRFTIDGLLFPLLALALTYTAMLALAQGQHVALLRMAVPVLLALVGIRFLARVLTVVFPASSMARMVERLFYWLAWLAALLWIAGWLPPVIAELDAIRFNVGKSRLSLLALIQGVLGAGAVLVLTLWVSAALERRVMRQAAGDVSLRRMAANMVRSSLLFIGVLVALSTLGVDLTALSVLGGAFGVGLGFGLQKLASNYVSGFVILFERSLRIGDTVRVDNFEGRVMDIKTRYTLIRAPNGRESIVPNEKLIIERIENLTFADTRVLVTVDVPVSYDSDVARVQRILCDAASGCGRVLADPAPVARLVRFGAKGLEFQLLYWLADKTEDPLGIRSEVNLAILEALRAADVAMA